MDENLTLDGLALLYDMNHRQDSIIFEITQRCNLNCRYCYNVWKNHPR